MSRGKKWNTPKRHISKISGKYSQSVGVGGGKNGKFRFKFFRHKKRMAPLFEGHIAMRKFAAMEIWFYD